MAESKRVSATDLNKVDAYVLGPADYAEIPELTEEWFAKAQPHQAGRPVPRGRPKSASPKQAVNLRLSPRVIAGFRSQGTGWQTRINAVLERWLDERAAEG
jgi:uncharacterized protein (DUF4415 family)